MANEQIAPESSAKIHDLRQKILENQRLGRAASFGLKPEEIREGLELCRNLFGSGAPKKEKGRVASNKESNTPIDLNSLIPGLTVRKDL